MLNERVPAPNPGQALWVSYITGGFVEMVASLVLQELGIPIRGVDGVQKGRPFLIT